MRVSDHDYVLVNVFPLRIKEESGEIGVFFVMSYQGEDMCNPGFLKKIKARVFSEFGFVADRGYIYLTVKGIEVYGGCRKGFTSYPLGSWELVFGFLGLFFKKNHKRISLR